MYSITRSLTWTFLFNSRPDDDGVFIRYLARMASAKSQWYSLRISSTDGSFIEPGQFKAPASVEPRVDSQLLGLGVAPSGRRRATVLVWIPWNPPRERRSLPGDAENAKSTSERPVGPNLLERLLYFQWTAKCR